MTTTETDPMGPAMTDIQPRVVTSSPPPLDVDGAAALLGELYGIDGRVWSLGSHQDANFGVETESGQWLLKISNRDNPVSELVAHARLLDRLQAQGPDFRLPVPRTGLDGEFVQQVVLGGEVHAAVLLSMVPGVPMMDDPYLAPSVLRGIGTLVGRLAVHLEQLDVADFAELDRELQWGMRAAPLIVESLQEHIGDLRDRVLTASRASASAVAAVTRSVPRQVVHGDPTGNNIVFDRGVDGRPDPKGVIDFADAAVGWAIWDLVVCAVATQDHHGATVASIVPLVQAFDAVRPLSDIEIDAFWDLVVLRSCSLIASSTHRLSVDAANDYARNGLAGEIAMFEAAVSVPPAVATAMLRLALGREPHHVVLPDFSPILAETPVEIGLSSDDDWSDGDWLAPREVETLLQPAEGLTSTRFAEPQLPQTVLYAAAAPSTFALHRELRAAEPSPLRAPWAGSLRRSDDGWLVLEGSAVDFRVHGLSETSEGEVSAGQALGTLMPGCPTRVQTVAGGVVPPLYAPPLLAAAWRAVCPDPGPLFGILPVADSDAVTDDLVARRDRSFATQQGHYYATPPRIERGWREHLIDADARSYVDMVNNVTVAGHAHPAIVEAARDQWQRLNTNSRFNYEALVEVSERLVDLAPDGLDTVFLVNSGSETVDLALRLAWAASGRQRTVALEESYHGWTVASDGVSFSLSDNPKAHANRQSWATTVESPNAYRGTHGPDEVHRYADEAVGVIDDLASAGDAPGAFISESFLGNSGGVMLPDGYLKRIYAAVRRHGGVCIADEVQVGLGRLGHWFWGVDQQGVVPDILTIAKGLGNGHPVGAVITTREIAEKFKELGYFFASTGGSPVSARMASTVLDILRVEELPQRAARAGVRLRAGLEELMERHEIIGQIYGTGLYLGVELVRDRETREPATAEAYAICDRLLELGVVCQPTSERNCVLKIKPPLVISDESCDHFVAALDEALTHGW